MEKIYQLIVRDAISGSIYLKHFYSDRKFAEVMANQEANKYEHDPQKFCRSVTSGRNYYEIVLSHKYSTRLKNHMSFRVEEIPVDDSPYTIEVKAFDVICSLRHRGLITKTDVWDKTVKWTAINWCQVLSEEFSVDYDVAMDELRKAFMKIVNL